MTYEDVSRDFSNCRMSFRWFQGILEGFKTFQISQNVSCGFWSFICFLVQVSESVRGVSDMSAGFRRGSLGF